VTHTATWILSAAAASIAIVAGLVKVGRWISSVEDRLARHDKDLSRMGREEAALERERDQH
jgi:hypothetical protein